MSYNKGCFMWRRFDDCILMTNDMGRFAFIPKEDFLAFTNGVLADDRPSRMILEENGFLYTSSANFYVQRWAPDVAEMKRQAFTATQLFILVLTTACNQRCVYCQAGGSAHIGTMSEETALKAVDTAFESPTSVITLEFQGGEPTLNPCVLKAVIIEAEKRASETGKHVDFTIVTNLTCPDIELLSWLVDHGVNVSTSLDGFRMLHNVNRPLANGDGSYDALRKGWDVFRSLCASKGVSVEFAAIQTTTKFSLNHAVEIVREYIEHGARMLYLRPLTPLGVAKKNWDLIGYTAEMYVSFFRDCVDELIRLNISGIDITELTSANYLRRILRHSSSGHTEYCSPCGAATGQMAINWDGDVYTCDEGRMLAEMGDKAFRLGSVGDGYKTLIASTVAHSICVASCVEAIPFCSDCVYAPYCAVCPAVTYSVQGDLFEHSNHAYHCTIAKGILDYLFEIIKSDDARMEILWRWAKMV